jgi:hypothetical protein
LLQVAASGAALAAAASVQAQTAAPKLSEKDPQALALGYVTDNTKADKAKYPKRTPDQHCGVCALFQGKPGEAYAACPIFAGRLVSANGWCSSWVKKA